MGVENRQKNPRRWARAALAAVLGVAGAPAVAAPVAVLVERTASIYQEAVQGFVESFPDAQLIQLNGDPGDLQVRLDALRKSPPQLIVAIGIGPNLARAARQKFSGVPVLYCLALNPAQNLPNEDLGGVALDVTLPEQFAAIQQALPRMRRIGVIYNQPTSGALIERAQQHLKGTPLRLVTRDAATPQRAAQLMEELLGQVDAYWLLWDGVVANAGNFRRLKDLSLKYKVALIAPAVTFVESGALMSVSANYREAGRQAAEMARQVLDRKALPRNFRAEPPKKTSLTINKRVAAQIGISFPEGLRADFLAPP